MPLALQTINGIHVAAFSGSLDNSAGADLVSGIRTSVEKGAKIVLDCTLVSAMDVAGFKHLLALHRWSQVNNGRLVLAGMSPEAWSLIVENHCEKTFEAYPSVPAAFKALGVEDDPAPADGGVGGEFDDYSTAPPFGAPSGAAEADPYAEDFTFSSNPPAADPWGQPPAGSTGAPSSSWDTMPGAGGNDPWDRYNSPTGPASSGADANGAGKKKAKWPLWVGLGVAAVVLVLGAIWLVDYLKAPLVEVSVSSVEVEEGREPTDVKITVHYGKLVYEESDFPGDLYVDGPMDENAEPKIFQLAGVLKPGTRDAEIEFRVERNGRFSEPRVLTVVAKPKPLEWLFQPPKMKVGHKVFGYTKIASGAKQVTLRWLPEDPGGFEVTQDPKTPGHWSLNGIPAKPGKFKAEFTAEDMTGASQTKSWDVVFEGEPIEVKPATLEWPDQFRALALMAEKPVTGFATIVTGAETASAAWQPDPGGLMVKQSPGTTSWNLEGTPVNAGDFQLTVSATPKGGTQEVRQFPISIALSDRLGGGLLPPLIGSERPIIPQGGIPDQMRSFLLERIEKANDHFTDEDKTNLRKVVELLTDARMVATISFGTGKTAVTEKEARKLRFALKDAENRALLDDDDCEILVVGYASPSGTRAMNIRLSRERARSVNEQLRDELGRGADLCGDYGPTDLLSDDQLGNQVVEVYAGKIAIPDALEGIAERFKNEFNERHGR